MKIGFPGLGNMGTLPHDWLKWRTISPATSSRRMRRPGGQIVEIQRLLITRELMHYAL